jgi:hypothetical protein
MGIFQSTQFSAVFGFGLGMAEKKAAKKGSLDPAYSKNQWLIDQDWSLRILKTTGAKKVLASLGLAETFSFTAKGRLDGEREVPLVRIKVGPRTLAMKMSMLLDFPQCHTEIRAMLVQKKTGNDLVGKRLNCNSHMQYITHKYTYVVFCYSWNADQSREVQ